MSSKKNVSVEPLELKGRGKHKKKSGNEKVFKRRVRSDHGYPLIRFPKFLVKAGLKLNAEVVVEKKEGSNPLSWELVIKPHRRSEEVSE